MHGRRFCRQLSELTDAWLVELFDAAVRPAIPAVLALVAVGGYGRGELAPASDLDVVLLYEGRQAPAEVSERLWYPVWDAKLKLGHAVRTVKEALRLATDDLETATSLLTVRHLAGEPELTAALAEGARSHVATQARGLAGPARPARSRSATPSTARWPSCSSPTSRRAAAACATCTPWRGPTEAGDVLAGGDDEALRRPTTCSSPPGWSSTA